MNNIISLKFSEQPKPVQAQGLFPTTPILICPIVEIIEEVRQDRMVVLLDDEDRENEGDLVMAAKFATLEYINFMAKHGRGLICLTLTEARGKLLNLTPMVTKSGTKMGANFTISIEVPKV